MPGKISEYRVFFREFRRNFHSTGAISPSSGFLARALSRYVREGNPGKRILEVGPGTGAVTRHILAAMHPDDTLDLVELNDSFVEVLRKRLETDPEFRQFADRVQLHHRRVEDLPDELPYDVIISGLPLNNFAVSDVQTILGTLKKLLHPDGVLSYFEYVAARRVKSCVSRQKERQRLRGVGQLLGEALKKYEIHRDCIFFNVPPAWVHHVRFGPANH